VSQKPLRLDDVEADLVPGFWRRAVFANRQLPVEAVDRDAYVLCINAGPSPRYFWLRRASPG